MILDLPQTPTTVLNFSINYSSTSPHLTGLFSNYIYTLYTLSSMSSTGSDHSLPDNPFIPDAYSQDSFSQDRHRRGTMIVRGRDSPTPTTPHMATPALPDFGSLPTSAHSTPAPEVSQETVHLADLYAYLSEVGSAAHSQDAP